MAREPTAAERLRGQPTSALGSEIAPMAVNTRREGRNKNPASTVLPQVHSVFCISMPVETTGNGGQQHRLPRPPRRYSAAASLLACICPPGLVGNGKRAATSPDEGSQHAPVHHRDSQVDQQGSGGS